MVFAKVTYKWDRSLLNYQVEPLMGVWISISLGM